MNIVNLPNEVASRLNVLGLSMLKNYAFAIDIDGITPVFGSLLAGFQYCDGIQSKVQIRSVEEPGYRGVHEFPRRVTSNEVRLARGMTTSRALWDWHNTARNWSEGENDFCRNVTVKGLQWWADRAAYEVWAITLIRAWPSGWKAPRWHAVDQEIAIEELSLRYEAIRVEESIFAGLAGELIGSIST